VPPRRSDSATLLSLVEHNNSRRHSVVLWLEMRVRYDSAMHVVAVLAMHGVIPFDLAIPCEVFTYVRAPGIAEPYSVRVCGEAREVKAGAYDLRMSWDLSQLDHAQTIVVPGIRQPTMPIGEEVVAALQRAASRGTRIASICTGAFVLAAAGLLDGVRATTHWCFAGELAALYPRVAVDPNVLFVDQGKLLTSAGATAGIDLCLHMVRLDHGAVVAANAARLALVSLVRDGGQAQYIAYERSRIGTTLAPVLEWMDENLHRELSLATIAGRANMSTRTLSRRFKEQTNMTPLGWMLAARVRRAQALIESTTGTIEEVAAQVGFESAAALRRHFKGLVGVNPTAYRRTMGGRGSPDHKGSS
jgi:transcriptional regulator GlxA family with amidase domain